MLERLSEAFEAQRQFTANAAHELRTPLVPDAGTAGFISFHSDIRRNDECAEQTITMVTEQNERLSKMVKTLLDMSELQSVERDDIIMVDALVEEVIADLEPLAIEKNIRLIGNCRNANMHGKRYSDLQGGI